MYKTGLISIILALSLGTAAPVPERVLYEETGETATPGDAAGEWKETSDGAFYYVDGSPVSGWNRIDGIWYYFGADRIKKTGGKIGIYELDEEGKLINGDGSAPLPHGEIFNSSATGMPIRNAADFAGTEDDITELYKKHEDSSIQTKDEIIKVRYRYNALPMSEKARVHNEYMLADLENIYGVTYDYSSLFSDTEASTDSSYTKGTDYSFSLDDYTSALTVIVRFPETGNPSVSLSSPDGSMTVLEKDTAQIRNQSMNLYLTWTDSYLQIDIAHGEYGVWNIKTDSICSFATKEYAGSKSEIHAIPEDVVASKTDAEEIKGSGEENDKKIKSTIALISLFLLIILYIISRMMVNRHFSDQKKKPRKKTERKAGASSAPLPAEKDDSYDEYLTMKAELQAEYEGFDDPSEQEEEEENDAPISSPEPDDDFDAVEVTGSVEQFDDSYLAENMEEDWMSDYYFE